MIGIDTNVLIRYIVRDDPRQTVVATKFLERNITRDTPGYINQVVLCEIVWVLKKAYGCDKKVIVQAIEQILSTGEFVIEHTDSARQALADYQKGDADFSDYWIGSTNRRRGCEYTATFDQRALSHPAFRPCG